MADRPDHDLADRLLLLASEMGNVGYRGDKQVPHDLRAAAVRLRQLTDGTAELEHRVSDVWGESQFDWTVGRSSEGWFYYCGTMETPQRKSDWKHSGYEPTLTAALRRMIELQDAPSSRLTEAAARLLGGGE